MPQNHDTAAFPVSLSRWLLAAGLLSLLLRFWIAVTFPVTGDEAFFYWWGVYPDWGYSDHPPMVGWLIALMRATLGDSLWSIRLPIVLLPLALGAALWWALKPVDKVRAAWAVLFFWLAPLNWLNTLITTDTPLILWSVLSVAALMRAERRAQADRAAYGLYALSGFFLGCAFLSKYFSVVLGFTYFVYFMLYRRDRLAGFALLVLCALPGPAINIAYNMSHGWSNIMFNVYNRNEDAVFEWRKPLTYIGMMVYLITPVAVWMAFRYRQALAATARSQRLLACLVVVPLVFFALLSAKKVIGLHWVLSFYPFGFVFLAFALPADRLKACAKGLAVFAGLHVLVVAGLYMTSLDNWRSTKLYPQIIRSYKTAEMLQQVTVPGAVLMAEAYTPASIFGFERRQYMPVFGSGKFHARQDDMLVDFSLYQGKTIRIIVADPPKLEEFAPYFESVSALSFEQSGVPFYAVEGKGFNYPAYREGVLGVAFKRYFNIPSWLPMTGCPFCERYCGQVRCPR
ncbi:MULTISPECIES: glycosyltransferase family 39 protein [unclassified Polaromonas]|uniref:ArnT family glycosyltransferase n=1 Tax=unclassified Polaromonas TaxID=2638319 RepID=UPI000F07D184|nr:MULTISPECIES: glycosyltransferase family 39 protein [unclassified Polaromonas]AYQ27245.1 phospholipid carrier-dependent glycosyltransferase [Polaromonas sp. SP1]QGJ17914.1 phospholipid carrier-dependent glycosyltransferase [Polaromonas sp. Pch-P]